ncbi:hypothetical protein RQP53_20845 [Paucibacter sp. APW11]|uniref:Right handed beta helix domain-containing protein n=1 Tax=Roseateles aquae TaxID=3077235 RepID=A0ABU3PI05_9BURK|nr:hypothetical protein [Paucibacter sp. APW11]MDT9001738.1 hypothetical protein [Paucibacter sp. APW11]
MPRHRPTALAPSRRLLLAGLAVGSLPVWAAPKPSKPAAKNAKSPAQRLLRVGPGEAIKTLAEAARQCKDGDRIEVQAGDYVGDSASWSRKGLRLVAVGGRVRLRAAGRLAQDKAIFVISGEDVEIQGFDFSEARVPDSNGAGIRFESGSLRVIDCSFRHCEIGLLTNNDQKARLQIIGCEFMQAHEGPRFAHLLYVGRIAELSVHACYFHGGHKGHLLKSRAARNNIEYNRLTDEEGGSASYELEFPNGGQCRVIGNLIGQSADTDNHLMLSYGVEGYVWPTNTLDLAHNSWINAQRWPGGLLRVSPGAQRVRLYNNLIAGMGSLDILPGWESGGNTRFSLDPSALTADFAMPPDSRLHGSAAPLPEELRPRFQYRHPRQADLLLGPASDPGAVQRP